MTATAEQVEVLRDYCSMLVQGATERRERVNIVNQLLPAATAPDVRRALLTLVNMARTWFPGHNVDCNLLGSETEYRLTAAPSDHLTVDEQVPCEDTWCRYGVATGRPFQVTDSLGRDNLIVCDSPYTGQVRSYIGAPLVVRGWCVGMFCAYSGDPRDDWDTDQRGVIARLAGEASNILDAALRAG